MSSSMTIKRSASSTSLSSTMSISLSPTPQKYIPVHKRTPSNVTTVASLSRPSSPTWMDVEMAPRSGSYTRLSPLNHMRLTPRIRSDAPPSAPGAYSIDALLALRPMADDSIKDRLRETCPEVLMSRRIKKSIQYLTTHPEARVKIQSHNQQQHPELDSQEQHGLIKPMPSAFRQRSLPRRNRQGRGPERRKSALQDTWQGMRVTARQPLTLL